MKNRVSSVILSLTVLLGAGHVAAQTRPLGEPGGLAISGERLAGVFAVDSETDVNGTVQFGPGAPTTTVTRNENNATAIALLGNADEVGPAAIPRLALDVFVHPHITVGGSFMYFTNSGDSRAEGTQDPPGPGGPSDLDITETDTSSRTLIFSPRAGAGLMFTDMIGLWGRAGFSYAKQTEEVTARTIDPGDGSTETTETTTDFSLFSLPLDVLLLIRPVEAFAFGVGPFLEIPLSGDFELDQTGAGPDIAADGDTSAWSYGLTVSVIGFL